MTPDMWLGIGAQQQHDKRGDLGRVIYPLQGSILEFDINPWFTEWF